MSDSKKLPTIEVGDTVVFRTDLEVGETYGKLKFFPNMWDLIMEQPSRLVTHKYGFFKVENDACSMWFCPEMVRSVIKPSKARVYSESELRSAIEMARVGKKAFWGYTADAIIQSLNTEGK